MLSVVNFLFSRLECVAWLWAGRVWLLPWGPALCSNRTQHDTQKVKTTIIGKCTFFFFFNTLGSVWRGRLPCRELCPRLRGSSSCLWLLRSPLCLEVGRQSIDGHVRLPVYYRHRPYRLTTNQPCVPPSHSECFCWVMWSEAFSSNSCRLLSKAPPEMYVAQLFKRLVLKTTK